MGKGRRGAPSPKKRFNAAQSGNTAPKVQPEKPRVTPGERVSRAGRGLGGLAVSGTLGLMVVGGVLNAGRVGMNYLTMPAIRRDEAGPNAISYAITMSAASLAVAAVGAMGFAYRRWRRNHPKDAENTEQTAAAAVEDDSNGEGADEAPAVEAEPEAQELQDEAAGNLWTPELGDETEASGPAPMFVTDGVVYMAVGTVEEIQQHTQQPQQLPPNFEIPS